MIFNFFSYVMDIYEIIRTLFQHINANTNRVMKQIKNIDMIFLFSVHEPDKPHIKFVH